MKNKVFLIGRIGKDPELVTFENGNNAVNLSIAVDDSYKTKEGTKVKQTYWINLVGKGTIADLVQKYYSKGDQIGIEGKLIIRTYEKEGVKKYVTEIVIQNVIFEASIIKKNAPENEVSPEETEQEIEESDSKKSRKKK